MGRSNGGHQVDEVIPPATAEWEPRTEDQRDAVVRGPGAASTSECIATEGSAWGG
jgi:hypothetical protein